MGEELAAIPSGSGIVLLLDGSVGVGKTRILEEASAIGARLGLRVGSGQAEPHEQGILFAPLFDALFGGAAPLVDGGPSALRHSLPEERYWLLAELEQMLRSTACAAPLMICLDDAQWADAGTVAALRLLPARLRDLPIAWLVASRPNPRSREVSEALDELRKNGASVVSLGPLDEAAVAAITSNLTGAAPGVVVRKAAAGAGGNPCLLIDLMTGLREENLLRVQDGEVQLLAFRLPRRLLNSTRRRLDLLSRDACECVMAGVAFERRFSVTDVAQALRTSAASLLPVIGELIEADFFVEQQAKLEFSSLLLRDAVRASLPVTVLQALDRQIAGVLAERGPLPAEVATRLAAGAEPGDRTAIATLTEALRALVAHDPKTGLALGERTLELTASHHEQRGTVIAQTASARHAVHGGRSACEFVERSLRHALRGAQEAEVQLSVATMFTLPPDRRVSAGRRASTLEDLPAGLRARHLAWLVHNLNAAGHTREAEASLADAIVAVARSKDRSAGLALNVAQSGLEYGMSRFSSALAMAESAAAHATVDTYDHAREVLCQELRCELLMLLDRVEESRSLVARCISAAQRAGHLSALRLFEMLRGRQLLQIGRIDEARATFEEHVDFSNNTEIATVLDASALVALGRVALHTGDAQQTQRLAEIASQNLESDEPSVRSHTGWLLASQALAEGNTQAARDALRRAGVDAHQERSLRIPTDITDEIRLVKIALGACDDGLAETALIRAALRAELNPGVSSIEATAAHVRGLVQANPHDLSQAATLFERSSRPLAEMAALEDLATQHLHQGAPSHAIPALDRALRLAVRAGATLDAYRLRSQLRDLGERRRVVAVVPVTTGWEALTPSEMKVASLVADGMTNRAIAELLFLSPHTVSSHVRHVFAKLDIKSRVQLAALFSSRASDTGAANAGISIAP